MTQPKGNIHDALVSMSKPLSQIVADPEKARRHGKESIEGIKLSLLQYGQVFPVLVRKTSAYTYTCVAGSGRVTAAKELGWDGLACVEWDGTAEQAKAFALVDNKTAELSSWDSDKLADAISDLIDGPEEGVIDALGLKEDLVAAFVDDSSPEESFPDTQEPSPAVHKIIIHDPDLAFEIMTVIAGSIEKYGDMVDIK